MTTKKQIASLVFDPIEVPLEWKENGEVVRVRGTRVPLETIIQEYLKGETPEVIAQEFSSVKLPDVYAVITYYLRNRTAVDSYLAEIDRKADIIRQEIQEAQQASGLKETLLSRRAALENKRG